MTSNKYNQKVTKQDMVNKMTDLNDILNNSWDGIAIIDEFGNFVFTNKAFSPILNYTKSELLKLNFLNLIDSSTRDVIKFGLIKAKKLGSIRNLKLICNRKDKKKVFLEVSLTLMGNKKYFVLNAKDSTEDISKKTLMNKYILSCRLDMNFNITEISDAFTRLIKFDKHDLLNESIDKLQCEIKEYNNIQEILKDIDDDNDDWNGIINVISNDDKKLCLDTKINVVHNKYGDRVGYEFIFFDITKDLAQKQNSNHENIKQNFENISQTIDKVTNTWLDPLSKLDKHVNKLKEQDDIDQIKLITNDILKTQKTLVKEIEVFKKSFIVNEKYQIVDIKEILENIINMLEKNNSKHNIAINKTLNQVTKIKSAPQKLTDIIFSLITNSLEAFKRNMKKDALLDIGVNELEDEIVIQIIDNAGGIDINIIDRIFDPYFSTKNQPGKGMGLYTAKNIIQNYLDGKITIECEDDFTIATIYLPISS
jgi:PAS domain S-box-containing protein